MVDVACYYSVELARREMRQARRSSPAGNDPPNLADFALLKASREAGCDWKLKKTG